MTVAGPAGHPLLDQAVVAGIELAASAHRGRPWAWTGFTELDDLASHPCGVFHGEPFSVFAKLGVTPPAAGQFAAELSGLNLLHDLAPVMTPVPVGPGVIGLRAGALLLFEALPERPPGERSAQDWRSIGHALAALHQVHADRHGLATGGFFGPFAQDNRPVSASTWADFYAERRLVPYLRSAAASGHLPPDLAAGVEHVVNRLPSLCGPEPVPSLLHGDAQQHNFLSTPAGAVVIDPAPYFGHPEVDLALLDYFDPVPRDVLDAYRDLRPIDDGFPRRRELWRLFAYLAIITVAPPGPFRRQYLARLASAVRTYR
jgi:fructosamine-3-kinase